MPSDCGCQGVVLFSLITKRSRSSCISRDSKLRPWSLCNSRDPETAEVGHQSIHHRRCLLAGDGVDLRPLGEVVRGGQEVSISPVALRERSSDVTSSGSGTPACSTGFTLLTPTLTVALQVQPMISLTLSSVLFTARCPPEGPPWISANTSFTLPWEMTD
jgi:hypothetical protein